MYANGHINRLQNGGWGGGLFSKPMFPTHLELCCTYVGSLGNWCAEACSGEVESFIKSELQAFKRTTSACVLKHHASKPPTVLAGKNI